MILNRGTILKRRGMSILGQRMRRRHVTMKDSCLSKVMEWRATRHKNGSLGASH